jgi:hypothetical protein
LFLFDVEGLSGKHVVKQPSFIGVNIACTTTGTTCTPFHGIKITQSLELTEVTYNMGKSLNQEILHQN